MAASAKRVLVLNGPNLNLLGTREPDVYGATTLDDIEQALNDLAKDLDATVDCRQSNQEGQLIDWLHDARDSFDGVVINPGGLHSYFGIAASMESRYCSASCRSVEDAHISNIFRRVNRSAIRSVTFLTRADWFRDHGIRHPWLQFSRLDASCANRLSERRRLSKS